MSSGRRVEIRRQKRLFNDFFKIDELIVSHQQYDGRMSGEERRLAATAEHVGALFVNIDPFFFSQRQQLALLAARYRLPTSPSQRVSSEKVVVRSPRL